MLSLNKELFCCWFCMVGFGIGCKSVSNSIWHIIHSIQLPHSHKCAAHSTRLRSYPRVSLCVVFTPMEISFIRNSNSFSIFCLLCISKLMPLKIIQAFFSTLHRNKRLRALSILSKKFEYIVLTKWPNTKPKLVT